MAESPNGWSVWRRAVASALVVTFIVVSVADTVTTADAPWIVYVVLGAVIGALFPEVMELLWAAIVGRSGKQ